MTITPKETREALMDCNPTLPALLVSFRHQDGVVAAFDEDSQAMPEAEPEPSFLAEIVPADTASVRKAFDSLAGRGSAGDSEPPHDAIARQPGRGTPTWKLTLK